MPSFLDHPDYNSIAIILLLLLIVYYVGNFKKRIINAYHKVDTVKYLNTTAKIKALEFAPDSIISIDIHGDVVAWNSGAEKMFGHKEKDVLNKPLTIIIPEKYKDRHLQGMERLRQTGQSDVIGKSVELEGITKSGEIFPIELTIWQWKESDNIFYTGIIKDLSTSKLKERDYVCKIKMYERAEEAGKSGCWSWDVLSDTVYTSKGFNYIFGIDKNTVTSTYLLKRIFHEDLPKVEQAIKKAFETKEGYIIEYRVVSLSGELTPVEVNAKTYLNDKGELISITGTICII